MGSDPTADGRRNADRRAANWGLLCAFASALAAIVAAFTGPCAAYRIATDQIRADLIWSARRDNIETIRSEVAEFLAVLMSVRVAWVNPSLIEGGKPGFSKKLERAKELREIVNLRLTTDSREGPQLISKMDEVIALTLPEAPAQMNVKKLEQLNAEIRELTRKILDAELRDLQSESGVD